MHNVQGRTTVNSLTRILPFLWPSRKQLLLSFLFAGLVAILWGGVLSVAYPVIEVLMQKKTLATYVELEIEKCEESIRQAGVDLAEIDEKMSEVGKEQEISFTRKKSRAESSMARASQRLAILRWVNFYLVPRIPQDLFSSFALILAVLLVLTLLKLGCMFAEEVLVGSVVQLTVLRVRQECLRRVLALDYQTLRLQGTSDLMARFTYDIEALGAGLALLGGKLVREPLKAVACLAAAFWVNWQLTLLSILFVPLAGVVFHRIGRMLKKASQKSMESVARIYKVLEETFESMKVVIAFGGELRHRQQHHRESKTYYRKSMKIVMADALTSPVTELLGMSAVALALLPGAYLVLRDTTKIWEIQLAPAPMDTAELGLLYAMLVGVLDPIRKLSSIFSKLKRAGAAADRVFELIDLKPLVEDPGEPKPLPAEFKAIEFRQVGFTYVTKGHSRPIVLDDISLSVKQGEVVAVVGENGSGKSTLVNLLPRFYDPDRGAVLIDGIDIRDAALADLRSRIGVVTQETLLFDDTIYENIRYGNPQASRDDIERAAEQAHVTQFLDQLPEGFQTRVGEKGTSLSGGQRQRIALARAILRNPSILILDEATNAIDSQSERLIHGALETFVEGRTTFIITHSISESIQKLVTRIVVLDRGQLVATGAHADLLNACSVYRRLFQSNGQPPAEGTSGEREPRGRETRLLAAISEKPSKAGDLPAGAAPSAEAARQNRRDVA